MALLYFIEGTCISTQHTFPQVDLEHVRPPENNFLEVLEPEYKDIPPGMLRRMCKAIRTGVGAAMPLLKKHEVEGIIIGTSMGGIDDSMKFLQQIMQYNEGRLTPGSFVGSTANAIASQLGLLTSNKGYNNTHVHGGHSFENALLDAVMLLAENKSHQYLVGGVDEMSGFNYNTEKLAGRFKNNPVATFYDDSDGTMPGEAAALFIVTANPANAMAQLDAIEYFHTENLEELKERIVSFIERNGQPDLFLRGENGDRRHMKFYECWEELTSAATVARFKHFCGEIATASSVAVFISMQLFQGTPLPEHMLVKGNKNRVFEKILLVNHYKDNQFSLLLLSKPLD